MLPLSHRIAFLVFSLAAIPIGAKGFYQLYLRVKRGAADSEPRFDHIARRIWYALVTTLTQSRTFRKRPAVSLLHSFIFYGFVFYLLANLIDAIEGYLPISVSSGSLTGAIYNVLADVLSFLVLVGVVGLMLRRFLLAGRRDFKFGERVLLSRDVQRSYIERDSVVVSVFILFHVGSRIVGAAAKLAETGPDRFQPFADFVSHLFNASNAEAWRIFGYWGALGSVLVFLSYFPYTKHIHLFMAPLNYLFRREASSGVLPPVDLDVETEDRGVGARRLEDLAWPRILDAYACIQCNRCQDVCPASATGKALSPAALEINKRMELNDLARFSGDAGSVSFEDGGASPHPLLKFAISPEAVWACTTCGACMEVCPVQDEPMLDIIDIRRNLVMMEGEFPAQLQTAFRGMERARNPWGINHDRRLAWAEGLDVKTTEENPTPDVLYWVGCAASYDPQAQKVARAFVQLLAIAEVNFSVLGKRECCTGDSARRAGNEYLYRQLADQNVATLNDVNPKLIVASCPHCMNAIGHEYRQMGGNYRVMHHTEYLESLVAEGKLVADSSAVAMTYHDPCYLGRHNGVYDAPRNLLRALGNDMVELKRSRENSFCCGAGGAQFWKEEEAGGERVSDNRFREVQRALEPKQGEKVLAVGCPFCKSMLESTPLRAAASEIVIRDVAELLLEGVLRKKGCVDSASVPEVLLTTDAVPQDGVEPARSNLQEALPVGPSVKSLQESAGVDDGTPDSAQTIEPPSAELKVERKKWNPKK